MRKYSELFVRSYNWVSIEMKQEKKIKGKVTKIKKQLVII